MSQTTRCPSCNACFKVVADQLRISDGWVRCGACSQVFDATIFLAPAAPPALLPDLNLENLRGPVERAKPAPAPWVAWQAPPATTAVTERPTEVDAWALRTARLAQAAPPALPIRASMSVAREASPTVSSTSWLSNRPSTTQPSDVGQVPPATEVPDADLGLSNAPWQLAGASRFDVTAPTAATESHDPDTSISKLPSALSPDAAVLPGYELPGSSTDDEGEGELLESILPEAPSVAVVEEPAPSGLDGEKSDLAHFLVEFTHALDSNLVDQNLRNATPTREHHEPKRSAEKPLPTVEFDIPEQVTPEAEADADADAEILPELEPQVPEQVPPLPDSVLDSPPTPSDSSIGPNADLQGNHVDQDDTSAQLGGFRNDDVEPAFVRHARRRAFWMDARVRTRLWLAALALVLVLAGQVVLQHRDQLAASFPETRAVLLSTCEILGCGIAPHRDISALLIEGSSFNRAQGNQYKFLLTLRNRSAQEVLTPVIELTLTDVQDQPVVRRVLTTAELNLPNVLQPKQEWSGEIPMTIATGTARIAGFRALAFYPN